MFKDKRFLMCCMNATCILLPVLATFLVACRDNPNQSGQTPFFESTTAPQGFFPRAEPEAVGMDRAALEAVVAEAQNTHSTALIVIKDGRVVAERYFGNLPKQQLRINSVTKSVVSLSIGQLIEDGKIPGHNTPISRWFPEWTVSKKAKITLRHLLTHTSGLFHEESAAKLYQQPDVVRYARGLPLTDEPGKNFSYSNEAVALIPGVVFAASGKPLDIYLHDRLFKPMGILDYKWDRDAAGNALAFGGLWLLPRDLVKIGQLMLDSGRWGGKQLVPAAWVRACTSPAGPSLSDYGLLWWLYPGPKGSASGFGANGWLGQYLIVYPKQHLVAVRLHSIEAGNDEGENKKYGFSSFRALVSAMVLPGAAAGDEKFKVEVH